MKQIYRANEVIERLGVSRSWFFSQIKEGRFPPGIRLGARARGWTEESIQKWLTDRATPSVRPF